MSRSRSPDRSVPSHPVGAQLTHSSAIASHDRPMSPEPQAEREPEPKRVRRESRVDDKARGKRLFGNLLGTLQKFKTEDKTSRTSEAVKRREEVAGRIAAKIRSENNLHHEIAESERELKTLRIQTDSAEYVLKHKDAAVSVFKPVGFGVGFGVSAESQMAARHAALRPTSRFLYTTMPLEWEDPLYEGNLLNPSPIPLNHGPSKKPPPIGEPKPLYYVSQSMPHPLTAATQNTLAAPGRRPQLPHRQHRRAHRGRSSRSGEGEAQRGRDVDQESGEDPGALEQARGVEKADPT